MGKKLLFAKTKLTLVTQAIYILESVIVLSIYIFKGGNYEKENCCITIIGFCS